jgi:uncharacterized Zn-finger protein
MNEILDQDPDAIVAASATVACDGGTLGHPRVYLRIGETREIVCPYCSQRFVLAEGAAPDAGH